MDRNRTNTLQSNPEDAILFFRKGGEKMHDTYLTNIIKAEKTNQLQNAKKQYKVLKAKILNNATSNLK